MAINEMFEGREQQPGASALHSLEQGAALAIMKGEEEDRPEGCPAYPEASSGRPTQSCGEAPFSLANRGGTSRNSSRLNNDRWQKPASGRHSMSDCFRANSMKTNIGVTF